MSMRASTEDLSSASGSNMMSAVHRPNLPRTAIWLQLVVKPSVEEAASTVQRAGFASASSSTAAASLAFSVGSATGADGGASSTGAVATSVGGALIAGCGAGTSE